MTGLPADRPGWRDLRSALRAYARLGARRRREVHRSVMRGQCPPDEAARTVALEWARVVTVGHWLYLAYYGVILLALTIVMEFLIPGPANGAGLSLLVFLGFLSWWTRREARRILTVCRPD